MKKIAIGILVVLLGLWIIFKIAEPESLRTPRGKIVSGENLMMNQNVLVERGWVCYVNNNNRMKRRRIFPYEFPEGFQFVDNCEDPGSEVDFELQPYIRVLGVTISNRARIKSIYE